MFLISWYIFTHDNSPSTAVRRYISLGFTHNVTKRLATFGYIEKEETTLALKALEEEYAGKCYMWPAKNKDGLFEGTYELYGQRFISYLKIDQRDDKRFTVISIAFVQPDRLITQKEIAYEIPYGVQIGGGVRIHYKAETAYLYSDVILQIDKYAKNEGVNGLHPAVYHVKMAHFLKEYLQSGLKVRVWTVNQESDMKMLIDSGITAIITNYPDKARMIREESERG